MNFKSVTFIILLACWSSTAGLSASTLMRFAYWNTFNNPDDETEDANFATIFSAMPAIDLWGVSETDTGSSDRMNSVLSTTSGQTWNYVTGASVGGDRTGIFWNTTTLTFLSGGEFATGMTRPTAYAKFRPVGTYGHADFAFVSAHLKSGSTSSDITIRGDEATALLSGFTTLDVSAILVAGDFNWAGASEVAYSNFTVGGFADVAGRPGEWRGNPDFKDLHTQDPRLKLDDRFDMMLGNQAWSDGAGIDYVGGSFKVFGNDGSHQVEGVLTANSEIDEPTLNALLASSDHLPIYATFTVVPEPGAAMLGMISILLMFRRKRSGIVVHRGSLQEANDGLTSQP